MSFRRNIVLASPAILFVGIATFAPGPCLAGPNDFFGTAVPSGTTAQPQEANPYADTPMPEGDFSQDEKRMQKRFKSKVKHAKNLVAKGKRMIEQGKKKNNKKMITKGKIFLDIGERELKQLAANNPLSNLLTPQQKTEMEKKAKKTAQSDSTVTN